MAEAGDEWKSLTVGVLNADGFNRHTTLNTPAKLTTGIVNLYDAKWAEKPNVMCTISEFAKNTKKPLIDQLNEGNTFDCVGGKFKSRDYIAAYWKNAEWDADYTDRKLLVDWSDEGKYMGFYFTDSELRKRICYVSVHMPRQKSKHTNPDKAYQLLRKYVDELRQKDDVDAFIIAGDFNMKPTELSAQFGALTLGIDDDRVITTTGNRSIDNVIFSDGINKQGEVEVLKDQIKLSHHPLTAELNIEH